MNDIRQFRKKPIVIEAARLDNKSSLRIDLVEWCDGKIRDDDGIDIPTLEGTMIASIGDWIIRGVKGEFYPCKPDIFAATYEAVDD